ncbi:MAG: hypothetical protein KGZ39_04595, partial [Simkania sp.]|nr:hypothetical protein [Simkania sp.]
MNYEALEILNQHKPEDGKFIIWVGDAHAATPHRSTSGEQREAGLAAFLGVPIVRCYDTVENEGCSELTFDTTQPISVPRVSIKRNLFWNRLQLSETEQQAITAYFTEKARSNGHRDTTKKAKDALQTALQWLYCNPFTSNFITEILRNQYLHLLKDHAWPYRSHQPSTDLCNIPLARRICHILNQQPVSIQFNSTKLSGFMSGGSCSAMAMQFLLHYCTLSGTGAFRSPKQLLTYILKHLNSYEELQAVQAALNTLEKTEDSDDFNRAKIEAMVSPYGYQVTQSSEVISLLDTQSFEAFQHAIDALPKDGVFFLRSILPSNNLKEEIHGHSTILIRDNGYSFFYDPNNGVKGMKSEKGIKVLYNDVLHSHLRFNAPILRIHQLRRKERGEDPLSEMLMQRRLQKIKLPLETIERFDPTIKYLLSNDPEKANKLIQSGLSIEHLAKLPISILLEALERPDSAIALHQSGISFESLQTLQPNVAIGVLKCSEQIRKSEIEKLKWLLNVCRFTAYVQGRPALAWHSARQALQALTHSSTLPALEYMSSQAGALIPFAHAPSPRDFLIKEVLLNFSPTPSADLPPFSNAGVLCHYQPLQFASVIRCFSAWLSVLSSDKQTQHVQNLEEDIHNPNVEAAVETLGPDSLEPILKLQAQGISAIEINTMPDVLSAALIELASSPNFESLADQHTIHWKTVLREEELLPLVQKIGDAKGFASIVQLRQKGIPLSALNLFSKKVLKALCMDAQAVCNLPVSKVNWKLLAEETEALEILLSRMGGARFANIIELYQAGITPEMLCTYDRRVCKGIIEAAKEVIHLQSTNKDWSRYAHDHVVAEWMGEGKEALFKNVLAFIDAGIKLEDLKQFALRYPERISMVLSLASPISEAFSAFGFDWKGFFSQKTFTQQVDFMHEAFFLNSPDRKHHSCVLVRNAFALHHYGITVDSLYELDSILCMGAIYSTSDLETLLKTKQLDWKAFIQAPYLRTFLTRFCHNAAGKEDPYSLRAAFKHLAQLHNTGITAEILFGCSREVSVGILGNVNLLKDLMKQGDFEWNRLIRYTELTPILQKMTENIPPHSPAYESTLAVSFSGILKLFVAGITPDTIAQLTQEGTGIRLKDVILCAHFIDLKKQAATNWKAFFSNKDVQLMLDKVGAEHVPKILSLYQENIDLKRLREYSPQNLMSILFSSDALCELEKLGESRWMDVAREPGLSRLMEKTGNTSFGSIVRLRLSGFSLDDLWMTPEPILLLLIKRSDAIYRLATKPLRSTSAIYHSQKSLAPKEDKMMALMWTMTTSETSSTPTISAEKTSNNPQHTFHNAMASKLIGSPEDVLRCILESPDPAYALDLFLSYKNIFESLIKLSPDSANKWLESECLELFRDRPILLELFEKGPCSSKADLSRNVWWQETVISRSRDFRKGISSILKEIDREITNEPASLDDERIEEQKTLPLYLERWEQRLNQPGAHIVRELQEALCCVDEDKIHLSVIPLAALAPVKKLFRLFTNYEMLL